MPRPVSWLPRLHEIKRSVANSVRSHYDRHDLEQLFELQPRAVQKILEILPTVAVGTARLVERDVLGKFLDRVREAEDIGRLYEQIRAEKPQAAKRKLRGLTRQDYESVELNSPPPSICLSPGRLEVRFQTTEELARGMYWLARVFETDLDGFRREFETKL